VRVEVRLFATLVEHVAGRTAGDPFPVDLADGSTLSDLLERLGVPPGEVHLAIVNGRAVQGLSATLAEGDRIGLFPPVGGG